MDSEQGGADTGDPVEGRGGAGGEGTERAGRNSAEVSRKSEGSGERASVFPPSLEAAWGLRPRPQKGPKRGLSLEAIVAAAVEVADTEGFDAVSMSRVAKALGVSTMALYRYVATKDELLMLMVDAALGAPPPLPEGLSWREGLRHWATSIRDALLAHPWTITLVLVHGPPATPNQLAWLDQALTALSGTTLTHIERVASALLVSEQARSAASIAVAMASDSSPDSEELGSQYTPFLLRVTADGRLPALRAAVEAGAFTDMDPATEEEEKYDDLAFGLERVLDGIEAYTAR